MRFEDPGRFPNVVRFGPQANIDWIGSNHFYHNTNTVFTCIGDSGGRAIETRSGTMAGVLANYDLTGNVGTSASNPVPACAQGNVKQRWARTSNKISWFNSVLAQFGAPQCSRSGVLNGITWRECF
jgi:hypothetical protein